MSSPVIEGKLEERIEFAGRWGRRCMQLLNDLKEKTGKCFFFYFICPTHGQYTPTIICWYTLCLYWAHIVKFYKMHGTCI